MRQGVGTGEVFENKVQTSFSEACTLFDCPSKRSKMSKAGKNELSIAENLSVFGFLKGEAVDKLLYGASRDTCIEFGFYRNSMAKVYKATKGVQNGVELLVTLKPKSSNRGSKDYTEQKLKDALLSVHMG